MYWMTNYTRLIVRTNSFRFAVPIVVFPNSNKISFLLTHALISRWIFVFIHPTRTKLLYPVTAYGIDTSVIEINRSLALTRNNLNIITITHNVFTIKYKFIQ